MSIADRDLFKARKIAARVVHRLGDRYWPIFELIDQAIADRLEREERIRLCLNSHQHEAVEADPGVSKR